MWGIIALNSICLHIDNNQFWILNPGRLTNLNQPPGGILEQRYVQAIK